LLVAGIGLMGGVIVYMTVKSQHQADELHVRLTQKDSESFRIADTFRDSLGALNSSLFHYGSEHRLVDREQYQKASDALDKWIDEQGPRLTTPQEKELLHKIDVAYDSYRAAATELQARLQSEEPHVATLADYADLLKESERLFD